MCIKKGRKPNYTSEYQYVKKKKKERDIDIEPFRALCLLYSTQHCPPVALGSMGVTCSFHFLFFFFISVPVDCASSVIVFILGLSISCLFSRSFHHSSFVLCTHPYNPSLETSYLTIYFFFLKHIFHTVRATSVSIVEQLP